MDSDNRTSVSLEDRALRKEGAVLACYQGLAVAKKDAKSGSVATIRRDASGRFIRGTKPPAGPGRPKGYADAFRSACSPDDVEEITRTLLELAKAGDVKAAEALLKRLVPERLAVENSGAASTIIIPIFGPDDPLGGQPQ